MKNYWMFLAATAALVAGQASAQTTTPSPAPNPSSVISGPQPVTPSPLVYTNDSAAYGNLDDTNRWAIASNWFRTNFTLAGTNVSPSFSNWVATNNLSAQNHPPKWTASNAWLTFSNWVQTNNFASASTNTVLTPTGRTATNSSPTTSQRLKNDFEDLKDLFRKKTNSP